jgi:hypothetical protein
MGASGTHGSNLDPFGLNEMQHKKKSATGAPFSLGFILEALKKLEPFGLNGCGCSWVLLGCSWMLLGAPGVLLGALGEPTLGSNLPIRLLYT